MQSVDAWMQEFARRALSKINELSQLEAMSNEKESKEVEQIFRHATIKVRYSQSAALYLVCSRVVLHVERHKVPVYFCSQACIV